MQGLGRAAQEIRRARTIAIACHVNPDGDCIGSLLALGLGLENWGKTVFLLSPGGVPRVFRDLPGASRIRHTISRPVELAVAVDCSAREMLGRTYGVFRRARSVLEIDHHELRRSFGNARFLDSRAAAVGEMVYILLRKLGIAITQDIARAILTSIIVETNSFRLPAVRPLTFHICARLMKTGVDFHRLSELVYWSRTSAALRMLGVCFSRSRLLYDGRVIWSAVARKDLERYGAKEEDLNSVAGELLSAKEAEVAVFFREKDRKSIKVSLRSKGRVNVAHVAERYHGGGHFDSAGFQMPNRPNARREVLRLFSERSLRK